MTVDVIATALVDMSKAMAKLNATRLTRRAIVTLIHEQSKVSRRDIELVLNNLEALETDWLKKV